MDKGEILVTQQVDPEKIMCKDCAYKNGGGLKYPHFTKGSCEKYPEPLGKPGEILFRNAKCEFYKHE